LIWDLDDLLDQLEEAVASTLKGLDSGNVSKRESVVGAGVVKITSGVSAGPFFPAKSYPRERPREPLVDVFEGAKGLRVLVELPAIKKEDIKVSSLDGLLRIEISHDGTVHQEDIPCVVTPGGAEVWSTKENDSVVELTLEGRRPRKE
jgi:hypothetical protein